RAGWAGAVGQVTWTNPGPATVRELVFTAHAHARLTRAEADSAAKVLELVRAAPGDALDAEPALEVKRAELRTGAGGSRAGELAWNFRADGTTLTVALPGPVAAGERVVLDLHVTLRLPAKQGRWGRWR